MGRDGVRTKQKKKKRNERKKVNKIAQGAQRAKKKFKENSEYCSCKGGENPYTTRRIKRKFCAKRKFHLSISTD